MSRRLISRWLISRWLISRRLISRWLISRWLLPGFCALAVVAFALGGAHAQDRTPAQSHDPSGHHGQGHAENHDWYQQLKRPGTTYSCCNARTSNTEGDCRPTRAYQKDDGMWYALLDGRWVPIPPRVVLQQLSPDGNSHICAGKSGVIYCFLGGSPKS